MTSKVFQTAEEMASYQAGRELAEALTVQTMSSSERYLWLQKNWGRLQAAANALLSDRPPSRPTARAFATPQEKNQFDDDRELTWALERSRRPN
ncbi:MAG: hypothetical protein D4R79_07795 [Comamonadaceae bacterium]|nr:MAG: hypothetical protein D4R79_07795 [Comamonadaceae bacterium]